MSIKEYISDHFSMNLLAAYLISSVQTDSLRLSYSIIPIDPTRLDCFESIVAHPVP